MNYNRFVLQMKILKSYRESKEDLEKEIDDICYQYCGVKGISYDKEPITSNPYITDEKMLLMSEALEIPQKELESTIYAIKQLEPIVYGDLYRLPEDVQKVCIKIFWNNETFDDVSKEVGYSRNGLWYRVKKEIEKL